jgi:hypothetical protein
MFSMRIGTRDAIINVPVPFLIRNEFISFGAPDLSTPGLSFSYFVRRLNFWFATTELKGTQNFMTGKY